MCCPPAVKMPAPLGVEIVVVVVEEMLAITELRSTPPDFRQLAKQSDNRLAIVVIEIVPAHRPIKHDASVAVARNPIVLAKFLPLRQQRRSLRRHECNQVRLNLRPIVVPIPLLKQHVVRVVVDADRTEVTDETLMIVILYILKPGLGQSVAVYRHRRWISVESKL